MKISNLIPILTSVSLNALAQFLLKKSVWGRNLTFDSFKEYWDILFNPWFLGGMLSYGISVVIWIFVLSKNPVSFSYPFLSIGYIIVTILGYWFFDEKITLQHLIGLLLIIIGIILISRQVVE